MVREKVEVPVFARGGWFDNNWNLVDCQTIEFERPIMGDISDMHISQSLTYSVHELVKIIEENRKKHVEDYTKSMEIYWKLLKKEMKKLAIKAEEQADIAYTSKLSKPVSYEKDYDKAIRMLTLTDMKTVELDQGTFSQLVMDEWSWKRNFDQNTQYFASNAC